MSKTAILTLSILFLGVVCSVSIYPESLYAQPDEPQGLVRCGNGVGADALECTLCNLEELADRVLKFIVILGTLVATLLFVNAGILYVLSPANPGNIQKAHNIFKNTLFGFILILAAWLIISLIMSTLYDGGTIGSWDSILCNNSGTGVPSVSSTSGGGTTGGTTGGTGGTAGTGGTTGGTGGTTGTGGVVVPPTGGTLTEAAARAALADNVTISPLVTSLNGIRATTVDGFNSMADASGVDRSGIVMTSGTDLPGAHSETGEYSHINGYKVDVDKRNAAFNNYIKSNFTQTGVREGAYGGPIYTSTINGKKVEAVEESRAWDITFFPG